MVPSSVAKMKIAGTDLPLAETTKLGVPLKTSPVGADCESAVGPGMVTTRGAAGLGAGVPSPRYSVDVPVPLLAIQTGLVSEKAIPHAFTRWGSVRSATPAISETRLTRRYSCARAAAPAKESAD